jgi:hypothetical protein
VAAIAEAVIGPMSGMVARLQLASSGLCQARIREDSPFQRVNTFVALLDLVSDLPKGDASQLWYLSVVEAGDQVLDLAAPLRSNDAEFGTMSAYGIDQHGALTVNRVVRPLDRSF